MAETEAGRPTKRYSLLGMDDLFMDYAGIQQEGHQSRLPLGRLRAGDLLQIQLREAKTYLTDKNNIPVAALSQTACRLWQ